MTKKPLFLILFILLNFHPLRAQVISENYLDGATVTGIVSEGGYLWIATYGQGIYRYSEKTGEWFNFSTARNNLDNDGFYDIAASRDYVWAGAVDGLYIYDIRRNSWRKRKFALGGLMGNWIRALCYDPSQKVLWIGRFENLTRLDVARQKYTDHILMQDNDAKTNNIKAISLDGDSCVWFGTESGVFKYRKKLSMDNRNAWQFINNKHGGFNEEGDAVSVSGMLFQPDAVWFGTDEFVSEKNPRFNVGGIYKYNRQHNWLRISDKDGLPADGVYCLARTGEMIWAGVYSFSMKEKRDYGKGLVLIDRESGKVTPIDLNEIKINSSKILSMYFDGSNMWLGTDNGLCKIVIENPLARWTSKKSDDRNDKSRSRRR